MIPLTSLFAGMVRSLDTISVRAAMRVLGAGVLFCVFLGAARGAETPATEDGPGSELPAAPVHDVDAAPADAPEPESSGIVEQPAVTAHADADATSAAPESIAAVPEDNSAELLQGRIAELLDVGTSFWHRGEFETAERVFADALSLKAPLDVKRALLRRMVGLYQKSDKPVRAIAVLEKYLQAYPDDPEYPQLMMRLGLLYRDTGAYSAATGRFYQVLNSTMRLREGNLDERRRLATKARLEIADTFLSQGNFAEARKYYSLLQLLDLEPADRERVAFREGQLQHELRLWQPAEKTLGAFLAAHADSAFAAEARYLRAQSLKELGRKDEAVQEVVALLRESDGAGDPARMRNVAYWKRRTGNELANTFYSEGDILGALAIYQALARASADPAWRWPAVYQVGLCFERLHLPQRAAEAYQIIVTPDAEPGESQPLSDTLVALQDMAKWRLEHMTWVDGFEQSLQSVTSTKPAAGS